MINKRFARFQIDDKYGNDEVYVYLIDLKNFEIISVMLNKDSKLKDDVLLF